MAFLQFILLLQLPIIFASAQNTIQWISCPTKYLNTTPIDCGSLSVPLDYTEPTSNESYQLDLLRAPTPVQPAKGSIILNFGGPGEAGRSSLATGAATLLA